MSGMAACGGDAPLLRGLDDELGAVGTASYGVAELCGRSSGAEPSQAGEVIGQVGHADLHLRAGQADAADEQRHAMLLRGENMLDAGADPGA